jgi:SRSO17 transposase
MPILKPQLNFIDKFLKHFSPIFTKRQMSLFRSFIYSMFSDYRRLSLSAIANNTALNYQRLQYFFSESNWDIQTLNNIRLRLIQNQRTTKGNNKGILAVDDTARAKPYAENTEGAQFQYCSLQWRYLRGDEIIALIKQFYPHKLMAVCIPQEDTKDKSVFGYSFNSKLKDCKTELKVIFIFDKWSEHDDKDVHILITTDRNQSVRSCILTYLLRWGIEESFRELKDIFCFDQYQVRHQEQIQRH